MLLFHESPIVFINVTEKSKDSRDHVVWGEHKERELSHESSQF